MWAIVALVVGTNLVTALLALLGTRKQLEHSGKRLERQLEAQRETDSKERRWQVRSQPLLELRAELARMAFKQHRLAEVSHQQYTVGRLYAWSKNNIMEEQLQQALQKAVSNWEIYEDSGDLQRALFMQYDHELICKVEEILNLYQSVYLRVKSRSNAWVPRDAQPQSDEAFVSENRSKISEAEVKITEVQELINKRLEEL